MDLRQILTKSDLIRSKIFADSGLKRARLCAIIKRKTQSYDISRLLPADAATSKPIAVEMITGGKRMKLLIFVLNDVEKLDELLLALSNGGLRGATILNSMGMASSLYSNGESVFMNSLKALLDPQNPENRTIFTVVDGQQEELFRETVNRVIGSLSEPNTGILFTLPIDSIEGLRL